MNPRVVRRERRDTGRRWYAGDRQPQPLGTGRIDRLQLKGGGHANRLVEQNRRVADLHPVAQDDQTTITAAQDKGYRPAGLRSGRHMKADPASCASSRAGPSGVAAGEISGTDATSVTTTVAPSRVIENSQRAKAIGSRIQP